MASRQGPATWTGADPKRLPTFVGVADTAFWEVLINDSSPIQLFIVGEGLVLLPRYSDGCPLGERRSLGRVGVRLWRTN